LQTRQTIQLNSMQQCCQYCIWDSTVRPSFAIYSLFFGLRTSFRYLKIFWSVFIMS